MRIYFLRHGAAEDRENWSGNDADRPLTGAGKKELRSLTRKFARLGFSIEEILSSPYARARSTAQIVAQGLGPSARFTLDERLAPGFDSALLRAITAERPRCASLMLVGHEPDFSRVIADITGGSVEMKKAGLARVDFDGASNSGVLVWLLTPKILLPGG